MSAYEALARSYDALTYDIPYEKIVQFWETLLRRYRLRPASVLDLACGTGSLAVLLAERGYAVTGSDISPDMLAVADEKASHLEENRPYFICQPMQRLRLPEPVDAVICCLDSLNYVTRPANVQKTFRRVHDTLTPGGLFLFDINTPCKLEGMDGQVFLDETEDTYCVWRAEYDAKRRLCYYGMDLFQRAGEVWERSFEEHIEYAYTPEELTDWLRAAGFAKIDMFGDRKCRAPKADELRVYIAARKDNT